MEVILEGFICEIESFHIIYFLSPKSLICPNKQDYRISVLHREAIKLPSCLTRVGLRGVTTFIQERRL